MYETESMATTDRYPRQATTLALAHALSAAERGLAVIPLSRNKLPALRSPHRDDPTATPCHGECGRPGHGVYDASTDPARIRELFAAAPWSTGYGIACGLPPHHLIGVDLDTKSGTDSTTALRELALRHLFTLPPTVVVLTPSGGRHLWLTGPADVVVPNSARAASPPASTSAARAATSSVPAPAPNTACTPPPPAPPTSSPPPAPGPFCACSSRRPAPPAPRPRQRAAPTAAASSSSSSRRTRASATPACTGRPAGPTRTASATSSATPSSTRPYAPA
ncbi:hypothetical protein RKD18_004224 [Streptomyces phaeoluteigriseus]